MRPIRCIFRLGGDSANTVLLVACLSKQNNLVIEGSRARGGDTPVTVDNEDNGISVVVGNSPHFHQSI